MAIDVLEMQLVSAVQRLATLQRRAGTDRDHGKLLERALKELEAALEEVRVAQEQLVENRTRMEQLQVELTKQSERYWELFDEMPQPYVVTRPGFAPSMGFARRLPRPPCLPGLTADDRTTERTRRPPAAAPGTEVGRPPPPVRACSAVARPSSSPFR